MEVPDPGAAPSPCRTPSDDRSPEFLSVKSLTESPLPVFLSLSALQTRSVSPLRVCGTAGASTSVCARLRIPRASVQWTLSSGKVSNFNPATVNVMRRSSSFQHHLHQTEADLLLLTALIMPGKVMGRYLEMSGHDYKNMQAKSTNAVQTCVCLVLVDVMCLRPEFVVFVLHERARWVCFSSCDTQCSCFPCQSRRNTFTSLSPHICIPLAAALKHVNTGRNL